MRLFEILKLVFTLVFISFNILSYLFVSHIEEQSKCKNKNCLNSDKLKQTYYVLDSVDFVKKFSMVAVGIGVINLFIPLTKTFINMFLIGGFLTLALLIVLILQAIALNKIITVIDSDECLAEGCSLNKHYKTFSQYVISSTITVYSITIGTILIGLRL